MGNTRFKAGDRVRIKSIDWYNENINNSSVIICGSESFTHPMSCFCGKIVTIVTIQDDCYRILEDDGDWYWTDEMIEGLVEEETKPLTYEETVEIIETMQGIGDSWECPQGYQFVDENGNVINATKIVLEKKHSDKLKLESTKKVREYWSESARIFIEIYDDEPNECIFTHLWVVGEQRQKGHGKRALIEAETIAKELGCHTAYLKVETDSWMHQWYLRCGYQWYNNAPDNYTWLIKNLNNRLMRNVRRY